MARRSGLGETMTFRQPTTSDAKWRERRRGVRMNSRVHIAVEWEENGKTVREEAITRMVSPYGCLVILRHDLALEHRLRLTNLDLRNTVDAVIVWRGNERSEGRELGLELVNPEMDFWGLEL